MIFHMGAELAALYLMLSITLMFQSPKPKATHDHVFIVSKQIVFNKSVELDSLLNPTLSTSPRMNT